MYLTLNFEILEKIPQATIIHHIDDENRIWANDGRKILCLEGKTWTQFAAFPISYPRDFFAFTRPTARAMRSDKCNLFVNHAGKRIGIRAGWVYAVEKEQTSPLFPIQGDCVLHGSIAQDEAGNIFFGEYFMNPVREPVRIWRVSKDLTEWYIAHEFHSIRHVHGIYLDPFKTNSFWITVGDFEGECQILRTEDAFQTFKKYGDGSQIWRAVYLFFTDGHINWLTDSNLEPNHACRMSRNTGSLEIGQPLDASAWYGCTTQEGTHFAFTTIEKGPAIRSNESSILVSTDAFHWEKVFAFKKDFLKPIQIFKYGVISCPSGKMSNQSLYLSGEGLVGLDGISIKARVF